MRGEVQPEPQSSWRARTALATATFALASLLGCDSTPDSVVEGVGAPTVLQSSDVHVVGTSDAIAAVEDLEVLLDGTVWVLNSLEPFFIGFGPDGDLLQVHGSRGGGPEEFRAPTAFVSGGIDGQAWVFDPPRHALIEVSRPGTAWSEISLSHDLLPPGSLRGGMNLFGLLSNGVRTARLGDEIVLATSTGTMDSGILSLWSLTWGADLVALDLETGSAREVISLREALGDPAIDFERTDGGIPLWFRLWAVCADTQIRVYDRLRNEVRAFTRDGTELAPTALPPVRVTQVTPRQFARGVFTFVFTEAAGEVGAEASAADSARVLNEIVQGVQGDPDQLATYLPRYVDFRCATDGTLWIQPYDLNVGSLIGGPAWLRIASDGVTDEIHLPDRFDAHRFTPDRIWGVPRDEYDVASVAWIAVPGGP